MTLSQYWNILRKRWRLIVICFLLGGAGASIGSKLTTPLYQSTALIQVAVGSGNNQLDYTSLLASDQLIQTEAILATSDPVLREVASHYRGLTVDQLSKEVVATPKTNTQLFEIDVLDASPTRAASLANDVAATLVKQQVQQTQQGTAASDLLIVQTAYPSLRPAQPNTLLNISAGLLTGLLLGMLLILVFEQLDTRVRTPEALTQLLNMPALATVWLARSAKQEDLLNPPGQDASIESYRILRTNIGFSGLDKPLQSLMVTSALFREGKSVIAANLAISMARVGKSTLLIDADLRNPTLHDLFGLPADKMGLSNAVLAFSAGNALSCSQPVSSTQSTHLSPAPETDVALEPFFHSVDIPNLWVMPSGTLPPNPPELLDSKAMQRLLVAIANCGAEVVIFDTPPLLGLSDASILASKVDGLLVVVDITRANKGNLQQLKAVLERTRARVLGCVVNKLPRNPKDATYYHHQTADLNNRGHQSTNNGIFSAMRVKSSAVLVRNDKGNHDVQEANSLVDQTKGFDAGENTVKLARLEHGKGGQHEK